MIYLVNKIEKNPSGVASPGPPLEAERFFTRSFDSIHNHHHTGRPIDLGWFSVNSYRFIDDNIDIGSRLRIERTPITCGSVSLCPAWIQVVTQSEQANPSCTWRCGI